MKTLENTKQNKVKTLEMVYSNMTFLIKAQTYFVDHFSGAYWVKTFFTAKIKETGECTGFMGSKNDIKNHLELINSRPDLFLK